MEKFTSRDDSEVHVVKEQKPHYRHSIRKSENHPAFSRHSIRSSDHKPEKGDSNT
jgi:hypothetical protein